MPTHSVYLHTLGIDVTLQFTHLRAAGQAAEMFTAITEAPWHTPDCVIECTWPELTREFVRSRALNSTGPLPGIRLFSPTHPSGREWKSADPPFPPVCVPAFQDRFVRFHGGAVADSASRGILILGESGYGKSTMCNQLVRNHGFRLLTDEDVFVHRRGRTVEPFPVGHALEKNGGKGIWELISQPTMIAPSAATIEQILVLRAPGTAVEALSYGAAGRSKARRVKSRRGDGHDPVTGALGPGCGGGCDLPAATEARSTCCNVTALGKTR
jgi:hypothetical protein